ncbi:hypothetical protein Pve01_33690 [Planomonospora venezuelensis]|nr:hypothetical protein Pve01_33690 [Planomonospora venezuelensis]
MDLLLGVQGLASCVAGWGLLLSESWHFTDSLFLTWDLSDVPVVGPFQGWWRSLPAAAAGSIWIIVGAFTAIGLARTPRAEGILATSLIVNVLALAVVWGVRLLF